jgi:hypothetical protein
MFEGFLVMVCSRKRVSMTQLLILLQ